MHLSLPRYSSKKKVVITSFNKIPLEEVVCMKEGSVSIYSASRENVAFSQHVNLIQCFLWQLDFSLRLWPCLLFFF